MIHFFKAGNSEVIAAKINSPVQHDTLEKLIWLFGQADYFDAPSIEGVFVGPRKEMITPWSTNAVEIAQNMGVEAVERIETFTISDIDEPEFDPMLQQIYKSLDQDIFTVNKQPEPILFIDDIEAYNTSEGLALSQDEIEYLKTLSRKLNRKLTDSEIFGFSQVNSEHCRHKIFNGKFIIDGEERPDSLFQLIKKTTNTHPNRVVSAYKDNCAFLQGPIVEQFAPHSQDKPDFFEVKEYASVISLKAETHNFPTTVEPFNGAATGSGGEIRDRIGGGKAAQPLAGTAVYMTSYPRLGDGRGWEKPIKERKWLYQTPEQILIKASNGASDFGNKFGQPLICGSVLTFEHDQDGKIYGYDKVIMLAGGIGFGKKKDSQKDVPGKGARIILMGGDNYRIGMGGGAVSSVATGEYANAIELNAVQRSNPEMQKRVANAIRALAELDENPIISIHDHGAGGHLNCLSELVEDTGGRVIMKKLPVGDPTLSDKEIIGNESQERMGLLLKKQDVKLLRDISDRERAPMYEIGETSDDRQFTFENGNGEKPMDLNIEDMFGNPPKTVMKDARVSAQFSDINYVPNKLKDYIFEVLQLESVACKDWLTNKVDRSVTGKIAMQQTAGKLQLPLNNLGIAAIDYRGKKGVATSIGHAPVSALANAASGTVLAIAEALTNIVWTPIEGGLSGVSLSANWMWPCKNPGEDARLYDAVQAASDFVIGLGINIPTGKDSLSMTQKYQDGTAVIAPGTVIISAAGEVIDVRKAISPVIHADETTSLIYINFSGEEAFSIDGSAFGQLLNRIGNQPPSVKHPGQFRKTFDTLQQLIKEGRIIAGHDIGSGGLITTLAEMCFSEPGTGLTISFEAFQEQEFTKILFSEKPAVVIQVSYADKETVLNTCREQAIQAMEIGHPNNGEVLSIQKGNTKIDLKIDELRDTWFRTSFLMDEKQTHIDLAKSRYEHYKDNALEYRFPSSFEGGFSSLGINPGRRAKSGIKAAIIREKGVNGDREMAWAMHLAGMDVKDVHMTDLISGRETLDDIHMIVFVGGFSNSDVLGSAKGWAGAFLYNPEAKAALDRFYARKDTLTLGVCNGCQLMIELGVVTPEHDQKPKMQRNISGKFESVFLNVDIPQNNAVMLQSLSGSQLGIWVAHGEGKFALPLSEQDYNIPIKYHYHNYPGNPNGSDYHTAALCSDDGRHLVMMPHLERSIHPWNWGYYPRERATDEVSPWIMAFIDARKWIEGKQ